ncbi:MAG: hypothetical protein H6922_04815 [Pseudomonadaceae bacterium]|nr:hypothetical protein [Pseudomonadaceae bacterium]
MSVRAAANATPPLKAGDVVNWVYAMPDGKEICDDGKPRPCLVLCAHDDQLVVVRLSTSDKRCYAIAKENHLVQWECSERAMWVGYVNTAHFNRVPRKILEGRNRLGQLANRRQLANLLDASLQAVCRGEEAYVGGMQCLGRRGREGLYRFLPCRYTINPQSGKLCLRMDEPQVARSWAREGVGAR